MKTYTHKQIDFGYSLQSKKWEFRPQANKGFVLLEAANGISNAIKIANIISGAIKRKGELDNLARASIDKVLSRS